MNDEFVTSGLTIKQFDVKIRDTCLLFKSDKKLYKQCENDINEKFFRHLKEKCLDIDAFSAFQILSTETNTLLQENKEFVEPVTFAAFLGLSLSIYNFGRSFFDQEEIKTIRDTSRFNLEQAQNLIQLMQDNNRIMMARIELNNYYSELVTKIEQAYKSFHPIAEGKAIPTDFLDILNITRHLDLKSQTQPQLIKCSLRKGLVSIVVASRKKENDLKIYKQSYMPVIDPKRPSCFF